MTPGPLLFARYAYPPNALGYCGGDDSRALLGYGAAGSSDGGLRALARAFEGAWPYLQLIASANHIADPLDRRVVEAYWIGNPLLAGVDPAIFAASVSERFGPRAAVDGDRLIAPILAGAMPHHNFHVFAVYPWVGLLREGRSIEPLRVLESCRIRWGTVVDVFGDRAVVETRRLSWDGRNLGLGLATPVEVRVSDAGDGFVHGLKRGDRVSMHWDWICDRLTSRQVDELHRATMRSLFAVNGPTSRAPAAVLD
jgi:uncharacterized protein DUF6390